MAQNHSWASERRWLFDAASLWVFLRAFGQTPGLRGLLVGYGLAGILALLPLTPGGLGIVEGTLVSVLPVVQGFSACAYLRYHPPGGWRSSGYPSRWQH